MGWDAALEPPIALDDGHALTTLRDAGAYVTALPESVQSRPEWQAAAEALMLVAERGGPAMLARIGMMRALNSGMPAPEQKRSARKYRVITSPREDS
jgi:hypothetical protein